MSNKNWLFIGFVVLIAAFFSVHQILNPKNPSTAELVQTQRSQPQNTDDILKKTITNENQNSRPEKQSSFVSGLSDCFPELSKKIETPLSFIQNWKSAHPKAVEITDSIHYFFKDSDNNEWRAQVLYEYPNGRPTREFRLFRILADGLPDRVKINDHDQHNPSDTTLNKYIKFDSVFEIQKKWTLSASEKSSIEVEESNSQIVEFQLFQDGTVFRCHEGDCECKK